MSKLGKNSSGKVQKKSGKAVANGTGPCCCTSTLPDGTYRLYASCNSDTSTYPCGNAIFAVANTGTLRSNFMYYGACLAYIGNVTVDATHPYTATLLDGSQTVVASDDCRCFGANNYSSPNHRYTLAGFSFLGLSCAVASYGSGPGHWGDVGFSTYGYNGVSINGMVSDPCTSTSYSRNGTCSTRPYGNYDNGSAGLNSTGDNTCGTVFQYQGTFPVSWTNTIVPLGGGGSGASEYVIIGINLPYLVTNYSNAYGYNGPDGNGNIFIVTLNGVIGFYYWTAQYNVCDLRNAGTLVLSSSTSCPGTPIVIAGTVIVENVCTCC
jgi:hypothetical protein